MAQVNKKANHENADRNPDPITGAAGSHPVGTGLGAAAGGAAAGAAAGMVGGPIGTVAGAVIGGIAGGYAGKAVAESIDPTVENAYWEENYRDREYVPADADYRTYEPAYRYGWTARGQSESADFTAAERDLERDWQTQRGTSQLDWKSARPAVRDAWDRVNEQRDHE